MYIEPRIIKKYGRVKALEENTPDEGEKTAAMKARLKFEEKYPGIAEAYEVQIEQERIADEAVEQGFADPNVHQRPGWERFAEMAGEFFSRAKEYTEFAFGIGYARKLAANVIFKCRDTAAGSMSINMRIKPEELDTLEILTEEQRTAFIGAVTDEFEEILADYIERNL